MILLDYFVKFRAVGITFGTVSGSKDISDAILDLLKLTGAVAVATGFRRTLVDTRGIKIVLRTA